MRTYDLRAFISKTSIRTIGMSLPRSLYVIGSIAEELVSGVFCRPRTNEASLLHRRLSVAQMNELQNVSS